MPDSRQKKYVFRAQDFYDLLEKQGYTCALTGRELTPENTTAEHVLPLRKGGAHSRENIYLIDDGAAKIKRYLTEEEVVQIAADIINHRGAEFGYKLTKTKRKK